MNKLKKASIRNHDAMLRDLRADPEYAAEFVKVALEEMEDPDTCAAALLALRTVAEAYGMAKVAEEAGIQRESLYRSLSPSGNPTLKTLMAVMKAVGLRISAVPDKEHAHV
ncbi:MAG TPA: addiction module antidote protein [Gallionellaceae bacterium]|nr:addiction module antidote protein [Gallionellaceae bacterium]